MIRISLTSKTLFFITICLLVNYDQLFGQSDSLSTSLFDRSIEELINQEVTIATKSSQKLSQTPAVVSIITAEEIKTYGYRDLQEALSSLPGFEYSQIRIGSKIISVRGAVNIKQGGRMLILMDGIPVNGTMYGTSIYVGYEFDMDAIEKIEVIRGPGSALYGRNAFSCVINIISKKAIKNNRIKLGGNIGSFQSSELYGSYSIKKENFNSLISFKYLSTDFTDAKYEDGFGGMAPWNLTHDIYYLNINSHYKSVQFNFSYNNRNQGTTAPQYFATNGNNLINFLNSSISYSKNLNSKLDFLIRFYGRYETRIQDLEFFKPGVTDSVFIPAFNVYSPSIFSILPEGQYARASHNDYTYGGELEFKYKIRKNNSLLIGVQTDAHGVKDASALTNYIPLQIPAPIPFEYDQDSNVISYRTKDQLTEISEWITGDGHTYWNFGLYLQDIHYFTEHIGLTIGARLDVDSEIGYIINPRLGMVWEIIPAVSLKLLYGEAYRAPSTSEQYKVFGYDKGNENLEYEEIQTNEIALSYQTKKIFSQLSLYLNNLNNIIQPIALENGIISYVNSGKNQAYGFEFENKYLINKNLNLFLNFDYKNSFIINDKSRMALPNVTNLIVKTGGAWHILPKLIYSGSLYYYGLTEKFPNTYPLLNKEFVSQDEVGKFLLFNSSLQLNNVIPNLDFGIYGYNLLNETYYFQDDLSEHQPKQPGIHFLFKLNYKMN